MREGEEGDLMLGWMRDGAVELVLVTSARPGLGL